jgi:hypothetical protein
MIKLHRYVQQDVMIDGIVGRLLPPQEPDSHYRFMCRKEDGLYACIVSGPALRPATDDVPHGKRSFYLREQTQGIVGTSYRIER